MIRINELEANKDAYRRQFAEAKPFSHLVIDGFCDADRLSRLLEQIPDPAATGIAKSRDYVFANNKYEKSGLEKLGGEFAELFEDFMSQRMKDWLQFITGDPVFIDPKFHGGGIHQGGKSSFLDMHADFNFHPLHDNWFRNLNILLYLNHGWKPEYGGSLKLRHKDTGAQVEVEPLFNRCVIMHTREYTLHGYDRTNFPDGEYRRSIAAYAYSLVDERPATVRSTTWYPENAGIMKKVIGRSWPALVRVKTRFFGSATAKNQ